MNESLCLLDHRPHRKESTRLTVLRGKGLGITPDETKRLSLDEFKVRVRRNFRKRAKIFHPDHGRNDSTGYQFRHLVESYHYLMDLQSKTIEEPIRYFPLPWNWQWSLSLPEGWQPVEN